MGLMEKRDTSQHVIVGVEIGCGFKVRASYLSLLDGCGGDSDNAAGDTSLNFKNSIQCALEAICPKVQASRSIDKLPGYPHPVSRLPNTPFKNVPDA